MKDGKVMRPGQINTPAVEQAQAKTPLNKMEFFGTPKEKSIMKWALLIVTIVLAILIAWYVMEKMKKRKSSAFDFGFY